MEAAVRQNLTWPNLRKYVEAAVKNCHEYQIDKKVRKKYGDLPEKLAGRPIAWNRVDVDLSIDNQDTKWKEIIVSHNNYISLNRLV
jgi:hypothetical protein